MVVSIDLIDPANYVHPPNKVDVGERLSRWALAHEYNRKIAYSGPSFKRAEISAGKITVRFPHTKSGLMIAEKEGLAAPKELPNAQLSHFELADKTGKWHSAKAVVQGETVVVSSRDLPDPIAVRYAYSIRPLNGILYNRDELSASPFCSDLRLHDNGPRLLKD